MRERLRVGPTWTPPRGRSISLHNSGTRPSAKDLRLPAASQRPAELLARVDGCVQATAEKLAPERRAAAPEASSARLVRAIPVVAGEAEDATLRQRLDVNWGRRTNRV
jgi:hypothetical protein